MEFLLPAEIDAVEVIIGATKTYYNHISIKKKNKGVRIQKRNPGLKTLEALIKVISPGRPVVLVISGRQILIKSIVSSSLKSNGNLIESVFPDSDSGAFLYSHETSQNDNHFLCIARKTFVEEMLKEFEQNKLYVVDVYIGPVVVKKIIPLIAQDRLLIETGHYTFKIENSDLIEITSSTKEPNYFQIGDQPISSKLVLPFSAAFSFL